MNLDINAILAQIQAFFGNIHFDFLANDILGKLSAGSSTFSDKVGGATDSISGTITEGIGSSETLGGSSSPSADYGIRSSGTLGKVFSSISSTAQSVSR